MADGVTWPPTGIEFATDDCGADGQAEVVKLAISANGDATRIPADATNGLAVDVTRIVPGTAATSLGKAEDAVAGSGDTGVMALAVRRDTPAADGADGDYTPLHVDSTGRLQTTAAVTGTFGVQTEDAVAGSGDTGVFALAVRKDTAGADSADGDYAALHTDSVGRLQVSGTQIEDAVAGSGDPGTFVLAVRRDSATSGAAAGDYHELQVDALGRLRVIPDTSEVRPSNSTTTALDNDGPVVAAQAAVLYGFQGYADAAGFVQVHNKATAPASTNVPVIVIPVTANSPFSLELGVRGRAFGTGIAFGFSSTGPTYTDGGSHLWVDAQFV